MAILIKHRPSGGHESDRSTVVASYDLSRPVPPRSEPLATDGIYIITAEPEDMAKIQAMLEHHHLPAFACCSKCIRHHFDGFHHAECCGRVATNPCDACGLADGHLPNCVFTHPVQRREADQPSAATKSDPVSHSAHYTFGQYEVRKVIEDWGLGFNDGNVVKYVARAGRKDPAKHLEDLQKAQQYLAFEIERVEKLGAGK